jgi:hypothetical protein
MYKDNWVHKNYSDGLSCKKVAYDTTGQILYLFINRGKQCPNPDGVL